MRPGRGDGRDGLLNHGDVAFCQERARPGGNQPTVSSHEDKGMLGEEVATLHLSRIEQFPASEHGHCVIKEHDTAQPVTPQELKGGLPVGCLMHHVAISLQHATQETAHGRAIIPDQAGNHGPHPHPPISSPTAVRAVSVLVPEEGGAYEKR